MESRILPCAGSDVENRDGVQDDIGNCRCLGELRRAQDGQNPRNSIRAESRRMYDG